MKYKTNEWFKSRFEILEGFEDENGNVKYKVQLIDQSGFTKSKPFEVTESQIDALVSNFPDGFYAVVKEENDLRPSILYRQDGQWAGNVEPYKVLFGPITKGRWS